MDNRNLFYEYPPLIDHTGGAAITNIICAAVAIIIGILITSMFYKRDSHHVDRIPNLILGLWILVVGLAFTIRSISYFHNYANFDTMVRGTAAGLGIIMLLFIPRGVKARMKEQHMHESALRQAKLAREMAEKAERKADELMEIIKNYEAKK